jgi:hypothetical protein
MSCALALLSCPSLLIVKVKAFSAGSRTADRHATGIGGRP